jgi:cephalosporin hydroxylase
MSQNVSSSSADSDVYIKGEKYSPPFANEPDTYSEFRKKQHLKRNEMLSSAKRFQRISEREDRTDVPSQSRINMSIGRNLVRYRGFDVCKSPIDFALYHQLFDMVKPKTVIELGTLSGGMAVWIADTLGLLGIKSNIYSMDLDPTNRSEIVNKLKPENVIFLQGDSYEIEKTFTDEFLKTLPHPWVFIEDAHANVDGVMEYFHRYLQEGDYMVVEDTGPDIPKECGMYMGREGDYVPMGPKQLQCLRQFLHDHEEFYAIDSFLTDLFGYNCSWHWHGFIRRMK